MKSRLAGYSRSVSQKALESTRKVSESSLARKTSSLFSKLSINKKNSLKAPGRGSNERSEGQENDSAERPDSISVLRGNRENEVGVEQEGLTKKELEQVVTGKGTAKLKQSVLTEEQVEQWETEDSEDSEVDTGDRWRRRGLIKGRCQKVGEVVLAPERRVGNRFEEEGDIDPKYLDIGISATKYGIPFAKDETKTLTVLGFVQLIGAETALNFDRWETTWQLFPLDDVTKETSDPEYRFIAGIPHHEIDIPRNKSIKQKTISLKPEIAAEFTGVGLHEGGMGTETTRLSRENDDLALLGGNVTGPNHSQLSWRLNNMGSTRPALKTEMAMEIVSAKETISINQQEFFACLGINSKKTFVVLHHRAKGLHQVPQYHRVKPLEGGDKLFKQAEGILNPATAPEKDESLSRANALNFIIRASYQQERVDEFLKDSKNALKSSKPENFEGARDVKESDALELDDNESTEKDQGEGSKSAARIRG